MAEPARELTSDHRPENAPAQPDGYKWRVLGVVVFGIFMVILDTTVVNVAFPTMRDQFHASLGASQWIVSLYVLALGITTPLAGYLSDRFGMKRMYLTGLALFVVGSLGSGIAPALPLLIATRALQGIGGGVAMPLGTAMLFAAFPPEEQGYALGLYGIALLVAPALGPILGGYLVDHGLWRWIFFINVPVGVLGVVLGTRLLRELRPDRDVRLDPWGLATSIVGFGGLLYAAGIAADAGWTAPPVLAGFAVGGVGLLAFFVVEAKVARDPLLDLHLFSNIIFLNATLVGWVTVMALFGAEFLMPIYLQMVRGRTAFHTGLILLPLAVTAGIVTPIAGRLYDRVGPRPLVVVGFSVLAVNTWQLSRLTGTTSITWVAMLMAMRGFAFGNTVQSTYATALGTVERMRVARGSSLINSTRFAVQAIAVAVLATIVASAQSPATRAMQQRVEQAPAAARAGIGICESTTAAGAAALVRAGAAMRSACHETMRGFESAYRVTFWFSLLALALAAFLPGWPFGWAGRKALQHASG
ncbi:MAG TPA: DHA2 family efflux MFS transporter permease subunit [Gemmatimonadaceae bacterium]|nr:DHA2 family efflux MFS transporter permease subunit [Gemmatimonadaceae bacterium]